MANIKPGITLFSLGTPYIKGELDLEGVIRTAAEMGAEGYEIVAAQMCPDYPYVSGEFVAFIEKCKDKYGIGPICYGANMDCGMLRDRDLTEDEMVARAIQDIVSANKLGCTVMREQYLLGAGGLKRLAPYAEAYNVKVGIEIHNPESPLTPAVQAFIQAIRETGSKYLGFVLDFGCFATKPNKPYWDRALAAGAPIEALEKMAQLRYDEVPQDEATRILMPDLQKYPVLFGTLSSMYGFVQFRKSCDAELKGMQDMMPYIFYMHGKCHYVSADLVEASIPYEQIIPAIQATDYDGYIVTEFEDEGGYDTVEMTRRHVAMMKKLLA